MWNCADRKAGDADPPRTSSATKLPAVGPRFTSAISWILASSPAAAQSRHGSTCLSY